MAFLPLGFDGEADNSDLIGASNIIIFNFEDKVIVDVIFVLRDRMVNIFLSKELPVFYF